MKLKIYNLFAPCYRNIQAMIDDIPRIASMGFNAVWLNPFLAVNLDKFVARNKDGFPGGDTFVSGSLYAATWEKAKDFPKCYRFLQTLSEGMGTEGMLAKFKEFTKTAMENGLVPMFDLVMNHVAEGAPCLDDPDLKDLFEPAPHPIFDDARGFQYGKDGEQASEIFERFWQEKINWMINELGFRGVRVDCVAYTNPKIMSQANRYIREELAKYKDELAELGFTEPPIFGELLDKRSEHVRSSLMTKLLEEDLGFSYIMNIANEMQLPSFNILAAGCDSLIVEINPKRRLCSAEGGTVGAPGTHDALSLRTFCEKAPAWYFGEDTPVDSKTLVRLMKEKLLLTALASDGGWFLLSGDEYGAKQQVRKPSPFLYLRASKDIEPIYRYDFFQALESFSRLEEFTSINLTDFIAAVNKLIDNIHYHKDTAYGVRVGVKDNVFVMVGSFEFEESNVVAIDLDAEELCLIKSRDYSKDLELFVNSLQESFESTMKIFEQCSASALVEKNSATTQAVSCLPLARLVMEEKKVVSVELDSEEELDSSVPE